MAEPTDQLIDSLANGLAPVRRLRPPMWRALGVAAAAVAVIALLTLWRGFRIDIADRMAEPGYWVQLIGAALTGVTATLAAFELSLPDRPRLWAMLPLPGAILWLAGFAVGCLAHWIAIPFGAPVMEESTRCLTTIVLAAIPLTFVLWAMLRRARPLRSAGTAWLAALAVSGYADTAHLLLHVVNASALVLVINLGPAAVILLAGGLGGRRGLNSAA